jgi:hypothetical protein
MNYSPSQHSNETFKEEMLNGLIIITIATFQSSMPISFS